MVQCRSYIFFTNTTTRKTCEILAAPVLRLSVHQLLVFIVHTDKILLLNHNGHICLKYKNYAVAILELDESCRTKRGFNSLQIYTKNHIVDAVWGPPQVSLRQFLSIDIWHFCSKQEPISPTFCNSKFSRYFFFQIATNLLHHENSASSSEICNDLRTRI